MSILTRTALGEYRDARAFLAEHPELRDEKSAVLEVAYEEYCRRAEAGERPDPDEFCARFPTFKTSLRRLIEAHNFLEDNPGLLGEPDGIAWPEPGEVFLGFALLRELGRGAFARVYLAAEPELGNRLVAVKVSPHGGREAETLGRINHPCIVPVYAVRSHEPSGLTAVCMPYLGTATLHDVLDAAWAGPDRPRRAGVVLEAARRGGGPDVPGARWLATPAILQRGTYVEGVCHLGLQMAGALAYIHGEGIYHRDLKPSNVLLCPDGRPMLLDFNLSADERRADERLGGTLPYMAPEQLRATDPDVAGEAPPVDARSDLYSLGVILYELLAGRHPFGPLSRQLPAWEARPLLLERQRQGAPPLRSHNPDVGAALAHLIQRTLAYAPDARPRSAAEVVAALRRELSPLRRLGRWLRRRPLTVAASLGLAVVVAGAGAGAWPTLGDDPFASAQQAYVHGQYDEALNFLDQLPRRAQQRREVLLFRGHVYSQKADFPSALTSYREAANQEEDGLVQACLGYCLSHTARHSDAVKAHRRALELGFATPEVYNNLAYSLIQLHARDEAEECLDNLACTDQHLPQAVYHNRFFLTLKQWQANDQPPPCPWEARADLDEALRAGPPSIELCCDAARLCVREEFQNAVPDWRERALSYLEIARGYGADLSAQAEDPSFLVVKNEPRFALATQPHLSKLHLLPTTRLLNPAASLQPILRQKP